MAENRLIQNSKTSRKNTRVIDQVTTTDATPKIAYSVPFGQARASFFQARLFAVSSDYSNLQAMDVQAGFRRPTGGNIMRATNDNGVGLPYLASSGDFSGLAPTVDLVANTSTQAIDIVVKGKAGITIKWYINAISIQNLD